MWAATFLGLRTAAADRSMDDVQWKVQGQGWCEVAMFVGLGMV
jgi:hypothetical protein